jgi:hypothetical protein
VAVPPWRRKRGNRYLVSWRLDDGSQGGKTVDTPDEARDLAAEKRLEMRRGSWRGRQRGRLPFSAWAADWWETWAANDPSPTTLAATESWLRLHVRPWFADRPIDKVTPPDVRRWQAQLAHDVGPSTVAHCRSLALRIFQFAMDEGAIDANPVRKVPPPKRRVDPEQVFGEVNRRALTPEEAGRLVACFPLFWWDHVLTLLGTGLRFGELAGLRRRRVHGACCGPCATVAPSASTSSPPGRARRVVGPSVQLLSSAPWGSCALPACAAVAVNDQDVTAGRWSAVPVARDPLLRGMFHPFRSFIGLR